jgi:hypothetical protein
MIWPSGEYFDVGAAFSKALSQLLFHNSRQPFIGLIYLVLALSSVVYLLRFIFKNNVGDNDNLRALVVLAFILGFFGMLIDNSFLLDTVSTWTMRDEMIFFGIISASIQLQRLNTGLLKNRRAVIQLLLLIQIGQLLAYTSYVLYFEKGDSYFYKKGGTSASNFYQSPTKGDKLYDWLQRNKEIYGTRILLSPLIEKDLSGENNFLKKEHFYSMPDLNIGTGLNVVNDVHLKGISMDRIYSSTRSTSGFIKSNYDVIRNSAFLDIAGVNWVLIKKQELVGNSPFPNLIEKDSFRFSWKDEVWVVLHNPDSWPNAFMMSSDVLKLKTSYRHKCGHRGILCADMERYLSHRLDTDVPKVGANGHVQLSFSPQSDNTVLGLSTMYRPEWEAVGNGQNLIVKPLFNAFIGVEVPSGVTEITLEFKPKARIWLNSLSLVTFVLCFVVIVVLIGREKKRIH